MNSQTSPYILAGDLILFFAEISFEILNCHENGLEVNLVRLSQNLLFMEQMSFPSSPILELYVIVVLFLLSGIEGLESYLLEREGSDRLFGFGCV